MSLGVVLPSSAGIGAGAAIAAAERWAAELERVAAVDYLVVTPAAGGGLSPVVLGAHLGALTERIGIVVEAAPAGAEPLHLSVALATLDHVTHGRAGWLVRSGAELGSGDRRAPEPEAIDTAAAVLDAVAQLWDSWEDDAEIRDAATGRFLDRRRLHRVDVAGPGFTIAGPSITPRPPQGRPVVIAGGDALEAALPPRAARWVDVTEGEEHVLLRPTASAFDALVLELGGGPGNGGPVPGVPEPPTLRERLGLARPRSAFAAGA